MNSKPQIPSLEMLKFIMEKFPIAAVISDKNDKNLFINTKFTELTGYKLEEVATTELWEEKAYPSKKYREFIQDSIPEIPEIPKIPKIPEIVNNLDQITDESSPQRLQHIRCKDGKIKSIVFQDVPISNEYFVTLLENLSEKTLIQQSLKEIQERYQRIVHFLPVPLVISNEQGKVLYINKKFEQTFGYSLKDIPDNDTWIAKVYPYLDLEKLSRLEKTKVSQAPRERKIVCKDGTKKWAIIEEIKIGNGEDITTFKDITAQKQAESIARDKTYEYQKIIEQASDMIIQIDPNRIIVGVNPACEEILGFSKEEMINHDFREFVDTNYWDRMDRMGDKKLSKETNQTTYEIEMIKKDKTRIFVEISSRFIYQDEKLQYATTFIRDISQRKKRIEEQLHREKLQSIGILAGGIAHDFNNILTSILGTINLLQINITDKENQEYLSDLEKATFRARDLTNQLLTFSKGGAPIKKLASIKEILYDTTKFVLRGSKIKYHFEIPEDLPDTKVDESQISQVINNLVINALQAMPDGGNLYVRAANIQISKDDVIPLSPGNYIQIEIEDTGPGIPFEFQKHIFEPYFSTKPTGSGLGLATSYSIIQNHEGLITFRTVKNKGTTFIILLPIIQSSSQSSKKEKSAIGSPKIEYILFYDDDEAIHTIMQRFCNYLDIKIKSAYTSQEVKEIFQKQQNSSKPFDVVITDLTIPGDLGGESILKMVKKIDSKIPVIVSSGYSTDPIIANFRQYGFDGFLKKPYTLKQLKQVLYQISSQSGENL
ncbi:MAG: PAS domain-containing hybrid sensor histidine kinase/response regulator [Promethearchaeota archaeon]